jgi:hypothetical protein
VLKINGSDGGFGMALRRGSVWLDLGIWVCGFVFAELVVVGLLDWVMAGLGDLVIGW